jgi:hypothetical protein
MNSRIMWVAALRALYLQALHPRVIRGTLQNAPGITQPVDGWARLQRTRKFIETRTFGTRTEAERAGRRVRMLPPVPDGHRVLKLGMPPVSALAFSTLPRWARHMYGRSSGPLSEAAATAGLVAVRLMLSRQRLFSGAMRAIHRAESAGDVLR